MRATTLAPLLAALAAPTALAVDPPALTVNGTGVVSAAPDTADVSVGVTTDAATAAEALAANTAAMRELFGVLAERGIASTDMQTSNFSVAPRYRYDNERNTQHLDGYQVNNQVNATVRDLSGLGALLDAVVAAGGNTVQGVTYTVAEPAALLDKARALAMEDARRKAGIYAGGAGRTLACVVQVSEHAPGMPGPVFAKAGMMRAESAVPVAGGELDFKADVSVTWRLGKNGEGCDE